MTTLRQKVVEIANGEVGYSVPFIGVKSNATKYTSELGWRADQWCADFVAWVVDKADGVLKNNDALYKSVLPSNPRWVPNFMDTTKSDARYFSKGNGTPRIGDFVITDGNGHMGIVTAVDTRAKTFSYVDGNNTYGGSTRQVRSHSGVSYTGSNNITGFVAVNYERFDTAPLRPDTYESNNTMNTAKTLPVARGTASQIDAMNLHNSSDVDYYKFTLSKTGGSHNKITLTSFVNGTQMELLDAGGSRQTFQSVSSANSTKTINLTGKRPGTYYLRISNLAGNSGEYRLTSWNTMSADNKEGNDSMAKATSLTGNTGSLSGVNIHAPSDVDYYKFTLAQQGTSNNFINLSGVHGEQATLLDSRGAVISTGRNNISLDRKAAGTYYLRVSSNASWGGDYRVSWNIVGQTPVLPSNTQREYESNNSMSLADRLSGTTGTLKGAIGSTGDEDWFKFTLGSRGTANNKIELASGNNSQRLVLYDARGSKISGNLSRSLSLSGKAAGTYYVKVYDGVDFASGDYTLRWNTATSSSSSSGSGSSSGATSSSGSNNNSLSTSTYLYASSGTRSDSISRSGEQDYFRIQLNSRGTSNNYVQTSFTHSRGDIDMELLDSSGRVLATSNGSSNTERISLSGKSAGTYYVRVKGYRNATNSYNISWNTATSSSSSSGSGSSSGGTSSSGSNNNSLSTATYLYASSGTRSDSISRSGEQDYFRIQLNSRGTSNNYVQTSFTHSRGDIDMELLDSSGRVLATSNGSSNTERISLSGKSAGTYYVRVKGYRNATNNYSISWNTSSSTTSGGSSSGSSSSSTSQREYESNNSRYSADYLSGTTGTMKGSIGSAGDKDYFKFNLSGRGTANNKLELTSGNNSQRLILYDANGGKISGSLSRSISLSGKTAGTYYVEVYDSVGFRSGDYTLSWNTASNSRSTSAATSRAATPSLTSAQNVMYDSAAGAFAGYINSTGAATQAVSQSTSDSLRKYGTLVQA